MITIIMREIERAALREKDRQPGERERGKESLIKNVKWSRKW